MTLGLFDIPLKEFEEGLYKPRYLDTLSDQDLVNSIIQFYSSIVGMRFGDVDWNELRIAIGDRQLFKAIRKIMTGFYTPLRDMKVCDTPVSPKVLRIQAFQQINKRFGGFASSENRRRIIKNVIHALRLPKSIELDEVLWCDEIDKAVIKKVEEPSVDKVVKEYNLQVFNTLCRNSIYIVIYFGEDCPAKDIIRSINRSSKLYGILWDAKYANNGYTIMIEGPKRLFGKASRYGYRIAQTLLTIIPLLRDCKAYWYIDAILYAKWADIKVRMLSNDIVPQLSLDHWLLIKPVFDSNILERIYEALKVLGLKISKCEDPVIINDTIYMPDFEIRANNDIFYVEVIGFWRRELAERVAKRLSFISKIVNNIMVIAEEPLKEFLDGIEIFTIYYRIIDGVPRAPYKKIVDYITKGMTKKKSHTKIV
ncbi:MAG: DUF790 family protein [Ignisphaera sp.]